MTSGITRYQPDVARGTIGTRITMPASTSAKPARMILARAPVPARFPATSAVANIVSDSGARDRPACIALYSSTICKKIGSAIIVPPSAICWSICPVMPKRKILDLNRSGSSRVGFPARFLLTSQ